MYDESDIKIKLFDVLKKLLITKEFWVVNVFIMLRTAWWKFEDVRKYRTEYEFRFVTEKC